MAGLKQITNPLGAFPPSGLTAASASDPGQIVQELQCSTTVTATAAVALSTTNTYKVAAAATDGTASLVVGIAITSGVSAGTCDVVTFGLAKAVPVAGAVAQGDVLKRSATTAGYLSATATPATGEKIAVALAASASNTVDVWVCK